MSVAVFYPCKPFEITDEVTKDIIANGIETVYPVLNHPPQDTDRGKREEFLHLLRDPCIDTLMVWRGGRIEDNGNLWKSAYGLLENLSEDDWDEIKQHPKRIVGYSDATYLLCALLSNGIDCFYGPNYNSTLQCLSKDELDTTLRYLAMALERKTDYTIFFEDEKLTLGCFKPWTINDGVTTGRLVGGNLDTIYDLLRNRNGNKWFSLQPADILFLEEVDPYYLRKDFSGIVSIHDKFAYLADKGVFSGIGGLLLGRSKSPTVHDPENGIFLEPVDNSIEQEYLAEVIRDALPADFPILANVACSHTHPMVTLPLGKTVALDATSKTLTVHV